MRASLGASDTAFSRARVLGFLVLAGSTAAGCAHAAPRHPPERRPPPHVLVVGLEEVAFRTTAWVELHAWLAARAPRSDDPEIVAAARDYATALSGDDRDAQLGRTTRALEACEDEKCARAAVTGTPFAAPYLAALPGFLARHWTERAAAARAGVEIARAALGPEVEPLAIKLAQDLAIDWPTPPPVVDMVSVAPEPGREAPVRILFSAQSNCLSTSRAESERVHGARIVDCVLAYAAIRLESRSALAKALSRELSARGLANELERAWTALVVHAVATTVSGWEPKHSSVLRQSAASVMPSAMKWLAREWPARLRGASIDDFAKAYAAGLADGLQAMARPAP